MLAICGRAGTRCQEPGARHLSKARRDASNLLTGQEPGTRCWKSVPGTCPRRGGMLAIVSRAGNRCQAPAQDAPGTCPGRGGMLAICGRAPRARDPSELVLT